MDYLLENLSTCENVCPFRVFTLIKTDVIDFFVDKCTYMFKIHILLSFFFLEFLLFLNVLLYYVKSVFIRSYYLTCPM
jgi:hypothetical protein